MDLLAGSGNDEFYTPPYAIYPILKYIKPNSSIWCPFDKEESFFVKIFRRKGHKVFYSHICSGENFFSMKVPECDYIISNPPYSLKTEVFKRLFQIGKPSQCSLELLVFSRARIGLICFVQTNLRLCILISAFVICKIIKKRENR